MSTSSTVRSAAAEEDSLEKEAKNRVYYEVETSTGRKAIVVYRVHEVYVHIPPELSAAGFELKIGGTVVITDQVGRIVFGVLYLEITVLPNYGHNYLCTSILSEAYMLYTMNTYPIVPMSELQQQRKALFCWHYG